MTLKQRAQRALKDECYLAAHGAGLIRDLMAELAKAKAGAVDAEGVLQGLNPDE